VYWWARESSYVAQNDNSSGNIYITADAGKFELGNISSIFASQVSGSLGNRSIIKTPCIIVSEATA
jgi:hypothetical protein